ncbi:hypothetical protein QN239_33405 [Mycolicibacterium sp. Y3]
MANTSNGAGSTKQGRSGTNKRRLNGLVGVRFETSDQVQALNAYAVRLGFKNAQQLILDRVERDLAEALKELDSTKELAS